MLLSSRGVIFFMNNCDLLTQQQLREQLLIEQRATNVDPVTVARVRDGHLVEVAAAVLLALGRLFALLVKLGDLLLPSD
jgi:hypothetical protein